MNNLNLDIKLSYDQTTNNYIATAKGIYRGEEVRVTAQGIGFAHALDMLEETLELMVACTYSDN